MKNVECKQRLRGKSQSVCLVYNMILDKILIKQILRRLRNDETRKNGTTKQTIPSRVKKLCVVVSAILHD